MSKRKRKTKPEIEASPSVVHAQIVSVATETKPENSTLDTLKTIVAELEANPLVPMTCDYPREYGEKIFPRYQKLLAQLKKLAE